MAEGAPRAPGDRGSGGERLEAALLAADAARAVGIHDGVADLAGKAAGTAMESTVEHDTGRDTGTDREVGEVVGVTDDAALVQADGGGTDVVLDDDREPELELQRVPQREVGPAEVDREGHVAALRVDAAGDADTDRDEVLAPQLGRGERLVEAGGDGEDGAALVTHGGGVGRTTEDGAVGVDDESRDLGATDVDPGDGTRAVAIERIVAVKRLDHRCTVSPSSRVSSSAQAPRSVTSSPVPPSTIVVSRPVRGQAASRGFLADGRQPRLAEGGDRADERDVADVERPDQVGDRAHRLLGRRSGRRSGHRSSPAAALSASSSRLDAPLARRIGGGTGDGLEAAEPAAVAFGAVGVDDDMADLAGRLPVATEQLVPEDETGADAAPDLDHDQVRRALVATEQVGREGRRAAVVGDDGREVVPLLEDPGERQVLPVEADRPADRAGLVDDARRPDADAEDRAGRRGSDFVDELVDDLRRRRRHRGRRGRGSRARRSRRGGWRGPR